MTLRQGDYPSSLWFGYGIDPLLIYLDRRLGRISIYSSPVSGPSTKNGPKGLAPLERKYRLIGYCDDVKPAINEWEEFNLIDKAVGMFEKASGCMLHCDVTLNP